MPGFDVSDAFDAEFFDTFNLHRRLETVNSHGRPDLVDTVTVGLYAVVTAATPNDLERWPEADLSKKSVTMVTQNRLQLASPGAPGSSYKADVIYWAGDFYQVGYVDDYSRFGEGYMFAIAQATDYTPAAPTPNVVP